MDFTALQTEFYACGFDYLNDGGAGVTRVKQWLNDAYYEICGAEDWPFLETSTSGASPLTVSDLRKVLTVNDATNLLPLRPTSRRYLIAHYGNVTSATGIARFYWVETTGGTSGVVRVFPVSGVTISVYYLKYPTALSAGADTPVIPSRYHNLIVHGAVRRGFEDQGAIDQAQAADMEFQKGLANMRTALLDIRTTLPDIDDEAEADFNVPSVPQK